MVPISGIQYNGSIMAIATTGPKEHRLRLSAEELALLVRLIDKALPFAYDSDRWYRAPSQREKYRDLRRLRAKLSHPSARGTRQTWRWSF